MQTTNPMEAHRTLQPAGWAAPVGYSNGIAAQGTSVFVAGQIGWDAQGAFAGDDLESQTRTALANVVAIVREAGGTPAHIVRMTWYILDRDEYNAARAAIGRAYREIMGNHYPAMALVIVAGLLEPRARVEIEATAVIP